MTTVPSESPPERLPVPDAPTAADLDRRDLRRFVEAGDREALGALAVRYERDLLGAAQGFLQGNHALAREAVQNAWVRVVRHGRSFDHRATVHTWLYRIVVNECRSLRRREVNRERRDRDRVPPNASPPSERHPASNDLAHAVASLPDHLRETILLCYHGQLTHAHVAEILMIPIGTVKSRLNAALTALRSALHGSDRP